MLGEGQQQKGQESGAKARGAEQQKGGLEPKATIKVIPAGLACLALAAVGAAISSRPARLHKNNLRRLLSHELVWVTKDLDAGFAVRVLYNMHSGTSRWHSCCEQRAQADQAALIAGLEEKVSLSGSHVHSPGVKP